MAEVMISVPDDLSVMVAKVFAKEVQVMVDALAQALEANPTDYLGYGVTVDCSCVLHHSIDFQIAVKSSFAAQDMDCYYTKWGYGGGATYRLKQK